MLRRSILMSCWVVAAGSSLLVGEVAGHEHHTVEEIDTEVPIDSIIWIHMILQTAVWGILFPIGMVLGMSKSRWHVPLQSTGLVLTVAGIIMGHHHKGRQFPYTAHGTMAKIITWIMSSQAVLGIYLKLHIQEKTVRPWAVRAHGVLGKTFPILGWVQMLLGVVTALGYCMGGALGQCLAHYIMGSAFIGYATIMIIMLQLGVEWLKRTGKSQEYLDSWVIMLWGIVNTFTEHHDAWNKNWSHKDMQHTMMGVLWWAGGALGIFMSRNGKRSFIPAIIVGMTGWGMSAHEQALMISSKIHGLFGYSLMAAAIVRIIEVCFVLNDGPADPGNVRILQYLPPYLLVLGGTLFMSATDEELKHVDDLGIDHVTYALFVFSLSFILFLHIAFLIHLYSHSGKNAKMTSMENISAKEAGYTALNGRPSHSAETEMAESFELEDQDHHPGENGYMNGNGNGNGHVLFDGKDQVDFLKDDDDEEP